MPKLGIDLGGTKIEIVALDESHAILFRRRVATPRDDYAATLQAVTDLVSEAEHAIGASCSVGIGTPGTISRRSGMLKNSNSLWLIGKPLKHDLEALLGREIRMANDANCFALSEALDGAGRGAGVVFGVILGTGVGGGIVANGRVIEGANAIAGEWGHNALPWPEAGEWPGPDCYCGRSGCIETFLSGPGLARDHREATGENLSPELIVARADQGDSRCEATLARYESRLARALAHVINILDPEVIVLGGGLSNIERWYKSVPKLWCDYVFSDDVETRLVMNAHGDSSGVRGAAWLWI
jgi:fructokinase